MQHDFRVSLFFVAAILIGACGARSATTVPDGATLPKNDRDFPIPPPPRKDATMIPDMAAAPLLEAVLSELQLPSSGTDYARDVDGDGHLDNALGTLLGQISAFMPLPLDGFLEQLFSGDAGFVLFRIYADGFDDSPGAELQIHAGVDADFDPGNNFHGNGLFQVSPEMPEGTVLYGGVRDHQLAAEGELMIPLAPLQGTPLLLAKGFLLAERFDPKGLHEGVVNGAIPWETVQDVLLPALAEVISQGGLSPQIARILDTNGDGWISAEELQDNPLVGMLLRPDIDLDGDGQPDAFSVGFGFSAVRCVIID